MDNLTHSLVGALIGQAGLKKKTGLAMPALIIGANIPDLDAACFFWLDGVEHLGFRRGITHGPIAWVLLPLALAAILWAFDRWQAKHGKRPEKRLPVSFKWLFLLSFIACLSHPALDWMNTYGIRLLEPFSHQWFYGDTLFIIDIWLWLGLGFATWFSLRREKRGGNWQRPAWIALALALLYVGGNYVISAIDKLNNASFEDSISSPPPIFSWQRETIGVAGDRFYLEGELLGNVRLEQCDLAAARAADTQVEAFLFWSRAPYIERQADGTLLLGDARFAGDLSRGRFTVTLPETVCQPLTNDND